MAKKTISSVEERDIPKMTIENWVLAIIYDKDERRPRDALGLMDEVFIFMKELLPSIEPEFGFKCNCCGPYSENVGTSVKQLLSTNMLEMKENELSAGRGYSYLLTESGAKKAEKLVLNLPETLREQMEFMNLATAHMGPIGMLQYIHSLYPEYVYLPEGGERIV